MQHRTVFDALDIEWSWLARSRTARQRLGTCAQREPCLARFESPGELVAFVQRRGDRVGSDRLLCALARCNPVEDFAGRCVLQAVVPGLRSMAWLYRGVDTSAGIAATAVDTAWEVIHGWGDDPRRRWVAQRIVWGARDALKRPPPPVNAPRDLYELAAPLSTAVSDSEFVLGLLNEAVADGAISAEDATLIAATRLTGRGIAAVAHPGESTDRLQKRRSRAEAVLFGRLS
jgi:hypothetical protein